MKVKREDFLSVVQRVVPAIRQRTTIPIISLIKAEAANGRFTATATDLDCFIQASCDCEGDLSPCCVAPRPLLALSAYGPDTMELSCDKSRLEVASGSKARLSVGNANEFPAFPSEKLVLLAVNPVDLAASLEATSWAADPKSMRGIDKQTVSVHMQAKQIKSAAMDGRRLAICSKPSIAPEAMLFFQASHFPLIVEALRDDVTRMSTTPDDWVVVGCKDFNVAVKQVPSFEFPFKPLMKSKEGAKPCGSFPRDSILRELETMQTIGQNLNGFVYGNATFNGDLSLDYVNSVNEFHSVIQSAPHSKSGAGPNVSAGAKPLLDAPMTAPNPTMTVSFDAALLHNILKHCPTESVTMSSDGMALFFESGDLLAALALVTNNP